MIRVPFNRNLDAIDAEHLQSEFERYAAEVLKNPEYGKKRAAREAKKRLYHEKKKKQRDTSEDSNRTWEEIG